MATGGRLSRNHISSKFSQVPGSLTYPNRTRRRCCQICILLEKVEKQAETASFSDVTISRHAALQNCHCTVGGHSAHRVCASSRVWTQESTCTVLETRITNCKKCIHNCVSKCWKPSEYPCVQIYVNLSSTGSRVLLHHTHESVRFNPECFCATKCSKNRAETEMLIASITENSTQFQPISFPCYYDPEGRQNNVLLTRFDLSNAMLHLSFWPSCIFLGGIVIIVMVKLTQYLSLLSEQSQMRKK
ncbi:calcium-activated potassium channel subunit beta-2 isoform X8 [Rhincodon typus]|uniref:calcium-activated potassium channel subunit beta-2 isoform X8 n=1 Tax=Rhincodon typus TaxID=259920 RepID=UPI0020309016|nr:calcium-activated potassium channel subunit beta-2 isoform X8 [Rhincodon typus]